jgi:hypothetical protein
VGNLKPIKPKTVTLQIINSGNLVGKRCKGDGMKAIKAAHPINIHSK